MGLVKNQKVIVEITEYSSCGEGVGIYNGNRVFVPYAAVGDIVEASVIYAKGEIANAKLVEVKTASKSRVAPRCGVFSKCGGCKFQHLKYLDQLKIKNKIVSDAFRKIGGINFEVSPCVASPLEYKYRNKMQMPFSQEKGKIECGFFAPYSHRMVSTNNCLLQSDSVNKIIEIVKEFLTKKNIAGYNELNGSGLFRHLVVREQPCGVLITLVLTANEAIGYNELIEKLNAQKQPFGLFVNINSERTNVILGDKFIHIYGMKELEVVENELSYSINVQSFVQVNDGIKNKLYEDVVKCSNASGNSVIINAYSGAGLLTANLAKYAKFAYGIEIVEAATLDADNLKLKNNITNMVNITGDCKEEFSKLIGKIKEDRLSSQNDSEIVLVLDPPKKGVDSSLILKTLELLPEKIIYISCNPATLARDVGILVNNLVYEGASLIKNKNPKPLYEIELIMPYDMFPQTDNVETLVCLKHLK